MVAPTKMFLGSSVSGSPKICGGKMNQFENLAFMFFLQMGGVEYPPTRLTDQHPAMQNLVKRFPVRDHAGPHVLHPKKHGQQESRLIERRFLFQTTIVMVHVGLGECTLIYQSVLFIFKRAATKTLLM